ncbi:hypothetical protein [Psychromicrobium sp. YIM B11713]|uniref:hypothetical protein n=1 Tax=Psychromicrobium sp. YIM B11713 TaxID=3145233 RepID=UPI00374F97E2
MLSTYASLPARAVINDTGITLMTWGLIIAGILMLATAFLPRLKTGQRVTAIIFGVLFIGYGIYVSLPSTRDVFISLYMFIVPVVVLIANISGSIKGNRDVTVQHHGPAGYDPQQNQGYPGQNPAGYGQPGQTGYYPQAGQQPSQGQNPSPAAYPDQSAPSGQSAQPPYGQQASPQPYQGQPGGDPYRQPTDPTA